MDEYIDILNENGQPKGVKVLKSEAHQKGLFHASVHIWFYTEKNELLFQQRKADKDTFPNLWDVSVAGHINFEETPINAAVRETEEEIGLKIKTSDLRNIGTSKHKIKHPNGIIDHELHHIFICKLDQDITRLKLQKSEVAAIKLMPIDVFNFERKFNKDIYVPHGDPYYDRIAKAIKQFQ